MSMSNTGVLQPSPGVSDQFHLDTPSRYVCVQVPSHLYVVLGERGSLVAENVSVTNTSMVVAPVWSHCSIQLVTCSTCLIQLVFRDLELDCGAVGVGECPCDHIWLSEQDKVPRAYFCSGEKELSYRSQTRYLSVNFAYSMSHKHPFDIEYVAERNRQYLKGAPGESNITFGGVVKSPFFPAYYPRDLGVEYVISCVKAADHCRIKLIFTDFLISPQSVMEFYDWTGHKLRLTNGIKPRPPVILSSGPSLMIRFLANGGFGLGYKGAYYFITGEPEIPSLLPITDCGGEVENLGGAITMMNMVRGASSKHYDCVWLIKPLPTFADQDLLLYIAVITFSNMGRNSEISVYEGQTSEGNLLDVVKPFSVIPKPQFVVSIHSGFYISLKATFKNTSSMAIGYSVFSNQECIGETEFLCQNHRCINKHLYCDGFDHCGDNSDEPETCTREWKFEPIDRRWYTHTPNYYFPKTDNYLDMKTATLIFILGSIGLLILLGTLVFLVYRMGMRTRQQRELQDRLQTITDLFDFRNHWSRDFNPLAIFQSSREGAQVSEMDLNDDPPIYEPPPSYSEVMKREKEKMLRQCGGQFVCLNSASQKQPDSPPPPYRDEQKPIEDMLNVWAPFSDNLDGAGPSSDPAPLLKPTDSIDLLPPEPGKPFNFGNLLGGECGCAGACSCAVTVRRGSLTWSPATSRFGTFDLLLHSVHSEAGPPSKGCNVKGSMSADNIFLAESA